MIDPRLFAPPPGDGSRLARDRRHHRRYLLRSASVELSLPAVVTVRDMSLTGMAVESGRALRVDRSCQLRLRHGDEVVALEVDVRWCRLVGTAPAGRREVRPVYRGGLDLRRSLDRKAPALLRFLEDHALVEPAGALHGRFTASVPSEAGTAAAGDFLVERLGLSGMVVRSPVAPRSGSQVTLQLRPGEQLVEALGKVASIERLQAEDGGEHFAVAVELQDLSGRQRSALRSFIERLLE